MQWRSANASLSRDFALTVSRSHFSSVHFLQNNPLGQIQAHTCHELVTTPRKYCARGDETIGRLVAPGKGERSAAAAAEPRSIRHMNKQAQQHGARRKRSCALSPSYDIFTHQPTAKNDKKCTTTTFAPTSWILLLLLLSLSPPLSLAQSSSSSCTPCANPEDSYAYPDKEVNVPTIGILPCSTLEQGIPLLYQQDDAHCPLIQSIGTYCGCPIPSNACALPCTNNLDTEAVIANFYTDSGESYSTTCDIANSYLQSMFQAESEDCLAYQAEWGQVCGCFTKQADYDDDNSLPNVTVDDTEDKALADETEMTTTTTTSITSCSLCADGSVPAFLDKDVSHFLQDIVAIYGHELEDDVKNAVVAAVGNNVTLSCGFVDTMMRTGNFNVCQASDEINALVRYGSGVCGCPPLFEDHCQLCPGEEIPFPDAHFPSPGITFGFGQYTCEEAKNGLTQAKSTDQLCWQVHRYAFQCGCNNGIPSYHGADTRTKQAILTWIPRVTGLLSFLGSTYIIQDICRRNRFFQATTRRRSASTYQYIILSISVFDISSSVAWMLSSWPSPVVQPDGHGPSATYGAKGNDMTCKTQGFFMELGFVGSSALNASLSIFYLLVIVYRYTDTRINKLLKWMIGVPVCLVLFCASYGIPVYNSYEVACLVPSAAYFHGEWLNVVLLSILPIGISTSIAVVCTVVITAFVWKRNRSANRWRFSTAASRSQQQQQSETGNGFWLEKFSIGFRRTFSRASTPDESRDTTGELGDDEEQPQRSIIPRPRRRPLQGKGVRQTPSLPSLFGMSCHFC